MSLPRILIIGQSFNKKSGGGVTISNLFKGWPKDKIAVATNTNLYGDLDTSVCDTYFQLGYNNKLHPFPLNIILPKIKCGIIPAENKKNENIKKVQQVKGGKYQIIYRALTALLHFFGIYHVFYKLKITSEFKEWLNEYKPDIIYSQLSTLELIRFVDKTHKLINKPIAIHIMDDWPLTINKPGILYIYWQKIIDKEFRDLLDKTSIFMSIGEAMSDEYKLRYHKNFIPFHNPIDINYWKPHTPKDYTVKNKFIILYAGRLGYGIESSITDIANAVNEIASTNNNIIFEIQTADIEALNKLVKLGENVKWMSPIEYSALPEKFSAVNLLLLPQDFDVKSVQFLKFSFPTKASEYMISGTPILVYGDKRTALTKYAIDEAWAYVVAEKSKNALIKAITEIYNNETLQKQLAITAQKIAIEKEDAEIVRENFRNCFKLN